MSFKLYGNTEGLSRTNLKDIEKLYQYQNSKENLIDEDFAKVLLDVSAKIKRMLAVLMDRNGQITYLVIGKKDILYLPPLSRLRSEGFRLRNLRYIVTDLSKNNKVAISQDLLVDLEKLRFDSLVVIKELNGEIVYSHSWNIPYDSSNNIATSTVSNKLLKDYRENFSRWILDLDDELYQHRPSGLKTDQERAIIIGVYPKTAPDPQQRVEELKQLATTAGINILEAYIQRRNPDPRTFLGKGKIQEIYLQAIRHSATMLIVDLELSPAQWRSITNLTDLKIIDRSMLILDIFAQHAKSKDGKLQVELAQLKYNLPKLVEKDAGLSRLSGGIGGRGPGETKLEVSKRFYRDRISQLEKEIEKISDQRALQRKKRDNIPVPLISLVGYTNVGKSSVFNFLTRSKVIVEDKLFATLDTTRRKLFLGGNDIDAWKNQVVISDTVGFIRELPQELVNAFRATLEEIALASLLIHVLDASDPDVLDAYDSVESQLNDQGFADIPRINVLNKIDLVSKKRIGEIQSELSCIPFSVYTKSGKKDLLEAIAKSSVFYEKNTASAEPD